MGGRFVAKDSLEETMARADIVQLIGEYVVLSPKGSGWVGCCPFHTEKTPSFHVDPERKLYHCFGCGASGNVFSFLREMEKITYVEAVEQIAKKVGVHLSYVGSGYDFQKQDENALLKAEYIELYNRVSTSFHYLLMETGAGKFALDYISKRGISKEILEKFKIGYSPKDRHWLRQFLTKKNYSREFLDNSGLFIKKVPELAFFTDRLMFPIFNRKGDVVAFGARFLRGNPDKSPKYLNSGELIQYKKGETLYAFNFAKTSIREHKAVIFCEGYMDCIAYHQCGISYAVAPLGTSLTEEQIKIIKPFVETVLLSFDSDGAGQTATKRAILMCRRQGITVKVIRLSGGKDPAEIMLNYGAEVLTNQVNAAILDNDFLLSKLKEVYPNTTPENKAKASLAFFEYVDSLQSDIQKNACLEQLCQTYNIELEAVKRDYNNRNQISQHARNVYTMQVEQEEASSVKQSAELRAVMTAVADNASLFQKMRSEITGDDLEDPQAKTLFMIMEDCFRSNNFSVNAIISRCVDGVLQRSVYESLDEYSDHQEQSVRDSIQLLKRSALERKRQDLQGLIDRLGSSALAEDRERLKDILSEKMNIDKQIALLKE